jgi:hypothetical protein
MTVSIYIDYRLIDSPNWITVSIKPEEYFDKSYFEEYPDEEYEWDSLPEFEDAIDYLDIDLEKVSHTRIRIFDSKNNVSRTFSEALWNNGENYIVERVDKHADKVEELIVLNIKLRENPVEWEILRIQKENGVPVLEFHSVITDNEDGSQKERIIYPIEISDNL